MRRWSLILWRHIDEVLTILEETIMRSLKYLALTAAAALIFSVGAFAKDFHSGSFDLDHTARIGSTVLAPGHYKAEWTGPNDALQVSIVQHVVGVPLGGEL